MTNTFIVETIPNSSVLLKIFFKDNHRLMNIESNNHPYIYPNDLLMSKPVPLDNEENL